MAHQQTFSIIKPDAVKRNLIGEINRRFEQAGLAIVAMKMLRMEPEKARSFYAEHSGRPFFDGLVEYMTSGTIVVQVLEGEDAVAANRTIMGSTDPAEAAPGTIRADFAHSIGENSVHGSDSPESAKREIALFFTADEIYPR